MDPITLATVTAAATTLGTECLKGMASESGKDLWGRIKSLFGWKEDPALPEIADKIARRLEADATLSKELIALLQSRPSETASQLVGHIVAEKVIVIGTNHGPIQM